MHNRKGIKGKGLKKKGLNEKELNKNVRLLKAKSNKLNTKWSGTVQCIDR